MALTAISEGLHAVTEYKANAWEAQLAERAPSQSSAAALSKQAAATNAGLWSIKENIMPKLLDQLIANCGVYLNVIDEMEELF